MNKYIVLIVSLLFLSVGFFSCKKDPPIPEPSEPVMPPLTHQGLNTFGCYIDGELFVANDGESVWDIPAVSGSFDEVSGRLNLQGTRYIDNEEEEVDYIQIGAYILEGESVYEYQYNEDGNSVGYRNWNGDKCDYYYKDDFLNTGELSITYHNEEKNIIAGTFYINLSSESYHCEMGDSLMHITDGRFDFHY